MHLENISIVNFKNIEDKTFEFCPNVNCIIGDNGIGKTNVLDAIHYLAMCKSFLNSSNDKQNIRYGEEFFVIQGNFSLEEQTEKIYCGIHQTSKRKSFKRNGIEYKRLSEHIGLLPIVVCSPSDNILFYEGDIRRKFIDSTISQFDSIYLKNLIAFEKALSNRNTLLRRCSEGENISEGEFEVWDMQFCMYAEKIYQTRKKFIDEIIPVFQHYYDIIAEKKDPVKLEYSSKMNETDIETILKNNLQKDKIVGYTTAGPHRDDYLFLLCENNIKLAGSQGQQKTFLTCLKFAQFNYMKNILGTKPLLLLDDIFDKLDHKRVTKISQLVSDDEFGQIFITDTSQDRMPKILKDLKISHTLYNLSE